MIILVFGMMGSIIGSAIQAMSQQQTNEMEYQHYLENREYNKPINQVQRLKEAGLNPVLAAGGFGSQQSPSPPSMVNPADGLGASLGAGMSSLDNLPLKKESLEVRKQELEMRKKMNDIKELLMMQGLEKGDLEMAIKALSLDTQTQMQPYVIQKVIDESGITSNKKGMSDMDLANHPTYLEGINQNLSSKTRQSNAMADYYEGKPSREQQQLNINAASSREQSRHNKEQERIADNAAKWSHADRVKACQIATDNYNLAVRKQNWQEAHYWYDLAAGVGSQIAKIASSAAGWKFGLPIDKWW